MNEQRERTATVYYDAQSNFGTPPTEIGRVDKNVVLYESVHTERRQPRRNSRDPLARPVMMAPITPSYEYSGAYRPFPTDNDFKPGPRASSAANIDSLFAPKQTRSQSSSSGGVSRITPARHHTDFAVIGAYSSPDREPVAYGVRKTESSKRGAVRQHSNDYELDPRLNVTYPQFHVDEWKHRHQNEFSSRPRFPSDSGAASRHLYEEVPSSASPNGNGYRSASGYGRNKETAILDDYDNVPNEFLAETHVQMKQKDDSSMDVESAIYQPGRYQPSEDAGSSSDEDDPEYLELMERDSIINRYENGPDAADVDAWENPDFELYTNLDRFGFVHKKGDKNDEPNEAQKRRILKELSREKKWLKMIEIWKSGGPSKKMEDRIWKGIPEKLRIVIWPRLLGAERLKHEKRDVYAELLLRARLVSKDIKQIDLDINRTYRDHLAFRKRYDVKQKSLLNVLAAYSMYNTEVGYCQGMSQIAALFLMYLDEEDAFWSLHQLMVSPKHTMHGFFVPGFPKLQRFEEHFKRVLKKYKPRVYKYLEKQDIPYIYLTKWWFGCFLDRVPFSLALRLWDVFLVEGDPILIAMAYNIMKMHEKSIRKHSMESFMEFIQNEIAQDFGYSDDEVMHSLRETLTKLKSDRQHVPPPPRPEDLSEVPTKALGPILHKPMASIRDEIHEIQSRRSRANSTGRSPYPKRKESSRQNHQSTNSGPPPVTHKWTAKSENEIIGGAVQNGRDVPFEIPTRRTMTPTSSASSRTPQYQKSNQQQRLRDERNGQTVLLTRASDSEGDVGSPAAAPNRENWHMSTATSRITHSGNNVTRIELDGDVSVI